LTTTRDDLPRLSLADAVREAYARGEEDESLEPIVRLDSAGRPVGRLGPGDSLIFYDIRGEREVEITRSLVDPAFDAFPVRGDLDLSFVTMIEYDPSLPVRVAFPPDGRLKNTLVEALSLSGRRVTKIAESEKQVHVGYFLNGKREEVFPGEDRVVVPSPECASYADKPEMSAAEVGRAVGTALADSFRDVIIANLANVDVVGHSEAKAAVLAAVECVDRVLGEVAAEARARGVTLVVTADHGTVEDWLYPDGQVNTGHTQSPVPLILADFSSSVREGVGLREGGELADVAPTVLAWLGLPVPPEMTGRSLLAAPPPKRSGRARLLLLILDGWGFRSDSYGNLIAEARTPNFDRLWARSPHTTLQASGEAVGMPSGTVGNSEAGHLHLGAGRRVWLDRVRIDRALADGGFFRNDAFLWAMDRARRGGRALHLMGIVSFYSSHGSLNHLLALLEMARRRGLPRVFIHSFIGRRGERAESGAAYIQKVEDRCRELSLGQVATIMGRFWSLDREGNWDRVEKAYRALVDGLGRPVRPED
jgi:2,3-bisphosphoglycerate-independent phosphoglycerate mutase